ncbi:hypothetical protein AB0N12_06520 [Streptomyces albogriseolus]|uniref:hypothetical protein n=1 Tax=Streptomyces albogriseolus TaxID=1887 RepID=UPI00346066FA
MKATRHAWLSAAHGTDWFRLNRHDDPDPADPPADPAADPADPPADPSADPEPGDDPEGADKLGDPGKKALEAMKRERAEAKRAAAAEKRRADELAAKVQEFEDRDKSELERAQAQAQRAQEAVAKATARAVQAEVKALAAEFADVDDAVVHLQAKMGSYATPDGDVDVESIKADLADILERKPHLRRADPSTDPGPGRKAPKPDPSQGPRPAPTPADYRNADRTTLKGELAKYGVRLRG